MEKYGTIPPKFTKAWWDYVWYYYKWYFLGGLFVLFLIATTVVQCTQKVDYDITLTYVGAPYFPEDMLARVEQGIAENIDDVTGNGKKEVFIQMLTQASGAQTIDPQYTYAMNMKATLEYQSGESVIFLYSRADMDNIAASDAIEGLFMPVREWNTAYTGDEAFFNLEGNAFFENLGVDTSDLYMAVRNIRRDETENQDSIKRYENAMKLAKIITENQ